jgi:hypothetical protein
MTPIELGLSYAKELSTQLITLSTGLLGLSITFGKEILGRAGDTKMGTLKTAWGLLVGSVIFGIWHLEALTGALLPRNAAPAFPTELGASARLPAAAQVVTFVVGTLLLVVSYGRRLGKPRPVGRYQAVASSDETLEADLNSSATDGWQVVSVSAAGAGRWLIVLRR